MPATPDVPLVRCSVLLNMLGSDTSPDSVPALSARFNNPGPTIILGNTRKIFVVVYNFEYHPNNQRL